MTARAIAAALVLAAACAATTPSPELVKARTAYKEAAAGPANEWVPDRLLEAKQALDAAEDEFAEHDNSASAVTLAYVAHRRVVIAEAAAGVAAARKDVEASEREYKELLERSVRQSRDRIGTAERKLDRTRTELDSQKRELDEKRTTLKDKQAELDREKAARSDAEARLKAAMKSLEDIAKVKEDARGTIITLSGAVLFKTNESTLLPIAERQLRTVAEALNAYDQGRKILVAGHSDARGSAVANRRLSLARAETVLAFLVKSGVSADRVTAVGKGKDEPIADNKTTEGRANNRRVEIIVEGTGR